MRRKKKAYFMNKDSIIKKAINHGLIKPFDDEFYSKLENTFIASIPVSMYLKYFNSINECGNWYDKSLYMFFAIPNTLLVRGKCKYSDNYTNHGWIEDDSYVYDPASLMIYNKEAYYMIYNPIDITKISLDEYLKDPSNKRLYDYIKKVNINDFLPGGYNRRDFLYMAKYLDEYRDNEDVNNYLNLLDYDCTDTINSFNEQIDALVKSKRY